MMSSVLVSFKDFHLTRRISLLNSIECFLNVDKNSKKLCMNLDLRDEKQNYYLTSLNCVVTIVTSVSCVKQKHYFFEKKNLFLAFTICFHKEFNI